jgi:hypothetical protein
MRLNDSRSRDRISQQQIDRQRVSVSKLVNELLLSLSDHFAGGNITVELDVQPLETSANAALITRAIKSLMQNALGAMPLGGELSVTLIDMPHQWELEIADTSTNRLVEAALKKSSVENPTPDSKPKTFPFQHDRDLRDVYAAADAHGGHVQTWDCPDGGTANVLVIPKQHRNAA